MTTAKEKNNQIREPLSSEQLIKFNEKFTNGKLRVIREPPWKCGSCGRDEVRVFRYIGDINPTTEWECICVHCYAVCTA